MPHDSGVDRLGETNYAEWSIKMEAYLDEKDLWDVTSGAETAPQTGPNSKASKAFVRKQRLARAVIIRHLENSQVSHALETDPKVVWENLAQVHRSRGFGTLLAMRRRFFSAAKDPEQSMQSWIASVRSAAFQLQLVDFEVKDIDLIIALTSSLPPSYDSLVVALDSIPVSELTVENVITRLLNEETRQSGGVRHANDHLTMLASSSSRKGNARTEELRCFNCRGRGHVARVCPSPKSVWSKEDKEDREDTRRANIAILDGDSDADSTY